MAEFIDTFEKTAGEGTVSSEYLFSSSFGVPGNCSAQIRCDPNFCTAVLNPYTLRPLRPLTGLHGDQMDQIAVHGWRWGQDRRTTCQGQTVEAGPPVGDVVPPPGQHAHPSFSTYVYGAAGSGAIAVDPPPPDTQRKAVWIPVVPVVSCSNSERA